MCAGDGFQSWGHVWRKEERGGRLLWNKHPPARSPPWPPVHSSCYFDGLPGPVNPITSQCYIQAYSPKGAASHSPSSSANSHCGDGTPCGAESRSLYFYDDKWTFDLTFSQFSPLLGAEVHRSPYL